MAAKLAKAGSLYFIYLSKFIWDIIVSDEMMKSNTALKSDYSSVHVQLKTASSKTEQAPPSTSDKDRQAMIEVILCTIHKMKSVGWFSILLIVTNIIFRCYHSNYHFPSTGYTEWPHWQESARKMQPRWHGVQFINQKNILANKQH